MQRNAWYVKVVVFVGSLGVLAGCGSSEPPAGCPPENMIHDACAGVPQAAVCTGDTCTGNVACKGVSQVEGDPALQMAAAKAMSGACIALAPGKYGAVTLPGGVSLLGKSAADVTVGKVTLNVGEGAVLRGFTTSAILVNGATGATIESVRVLGSADTGVLVAAQSSVAVITSTIEGSVLFGVSAVDALDVRLDRVVIVGSGLPGLSVASSSDCAAPPAQPTLEAKNSIVRDNHIAGVALHGTKATIQGVAILATIPGDMFHYGDGGGGLSIASCSDVDMKGLRVHDNKSYGVLVDASRGTIGGMGPDEDVEIHGNVIGLSLQNVNDSFKLENVQLDQNLGVGIGLRGASRGIVICKSGVSGTKMTSLPTLGGAKPVGHGLVWAENSSATLLDLALSGNALVSMLIDGEATGALDNVTLSGGDQDKGIVQQRFTSGMQPAIKGVTPSPQVAAGEVHPVPVPPTSVPKDL